MELTLKAKLIGIGEANIDGKQVCTADVEVSASWKQGLTGHSAESGTIPFTLPITREKAAELGGLLYQWVFVTISIDKDPPK